MNLIFSLPDARMSPPFLIVKTAAEIGKKNFELP